MMIIGFPMVWVGRFVIKASNIYTPSNLSDVIEFVLLLQSMQQLLQLNV